MKLIDLQRQENPNSVFWNSPYFFGKKKKKKKKKKSVKSTTYLGFLKIIWEHMLFRSLKIGCGKTFKSPEMSPTERAQIR